MNILYILIMISFVGQLVLDIVLIVKFFGIAADVKAIRRKMYSEIHEGFSSQNAKTPETVNLNTPLQKASSRVILTKGNSYDLGVLGICTFEGIYEGKYGFYPQGVIDRESIYFRDDVEPYYLIPETDLDKVISLT